MFKLEAKHCNCHPETCCCSDFQIVRVSNGNIVATGDNETEMENLVLYANIWAEKIKKQNEINDPEERDKILRDQMSTPYGLDS